MIHFRRKKLSRFPDCCLHLVSLEAAKESLVNLLLDECLGRDGCVRLLLRVHEDAGSVLGALIVSLLVERCRIVETEEKFAQLFHADFAGVKKNVTYLNVAGVTHAHFLILWGRMTRIFVRIHKTDGRSQNRAGKFFRKILGEVLFSAPVATGAEGCDSYAVVL